MRLWTQLVAWLQERFPTIGRRRAAVLPPMRLPCRDVVNLILAYLEGTLDPPERRAFEMHIADCANCWRFLHTYRETVALGQQLREEEIPQDVHERLKAFLRSRLPRTP
jgi:anti-sigma factor RsiW